MPAPVRFAYEPRTQFLDFHQRTERWAAMLCHRRAGKTYSCIGDTILRALQATKPDSRYAYIAPFRTQAKKIAWTYLKRLTDGLREGAPREADLEVRLFNGAWITLYGADNPNALRGLYLDGVVLDEYGDMKPSLMGEIIMPTLIDRQGWLTVIGTIKGKNQFYTLLQDAEKDPTWFYKKLIASQSGILLLQELAIIKSQMDPNEYAQEFECDANAALKGTYYAEILNDLEKEGHFSEKPLYNPKLKVKASSDLGFSDSTAFWFWQETDDGRFNIIDYHANDGQKPRFYLSMLKERGYDYEELWLPHDAKAKTFAGGGRTTIQQLLDPHSVCPEHYEPGSKLPFRIVPRGFVQHGIDAVRAILPQCYFDLTTCGAGIDALRTYHRQWNENFQAYEDQPVKRHWSKHGADAFRYFATVAKGSKGQSAESTQRQRRSRHNHIKGVLQYKDGRIVTTATLDEITGPLRMSHRSRRI